jgi:hypothetical protein
MSDIEQRLRVHLQRNVPSQIRSYLRRGGPTDEDRERVRGYCDDIGSYGDIMLYPDGSGSERVYMDELVDGVAVAAFSPGGIRCFGLDFAVSYETEQEQDEMQQFVGDIDRILEM